MKKKIESLNEVITVTATMTNTGTKIIGDKMTREEKVKQFRDAGGKCSFEETPDQSGMIMDLVFEEFLEFTDAAFMYEEAIENGAIRVNPAGLAEKRAAMVKEWADLQYVVSQAAIYYNIPADEAFDRVHDSNMTKVVDGQIIFREDGKILKPHTYVAPDMRGL